MNPYLKVVQKSLKNHFKIDQTTLKWFAKYKITQTTQVKNLSNKKLLEKGSKYSRNLLVSG